MAYIQKGVVKLLRPKMTKPLSLGVVDEHSKLSFTHDGTFLVGQRGMSLVAIPATALDVLDLSTDTRWSIEGVTMAGAVLLERAAPRVAHQH